MLTFLLRMVLVIAALAFFHTAHMGHFGFQMSLVDAGISKPPNMSIESRMLHTLTVHLVPALGLGMSMLCVAGILATYSEIWPGKSR